MRRSGYNVIKCNIDANLNANGKDSGIHKISLILTKKEITNIEIGNNFFLNHNCTILDAGKVIFGDHVFIGPDCGFYTVNHPFDVKKRNEGLEYAQPIRIGNHVWIGGGVRVMPGVTIGDNTIIGGGSVVTKDIPKNCLAFGNPCKVIRKITTSD